MSLNMDDIELKLLAGIPIEIEGIGKVYSPTLREIVSMGDTYYRVLLSAVTFDKKKIPESDEKYSDFDYLVLYAHHDQEFNKALLDGWGLLLTKDYTFSNVNNDVIAIDDSGQSIIHRDNYFELKKIIKIVNCLEGIESFEDNPANEKARQLLEKKKLLKQKVNKAKSGSDSEPLTLADLVSILAGTGNTYNLINNEHNPMSVWNLTIYQFNNAFNRLKMFKDYEVNIQALVHGAKSEDVKFEHWISKIKTNDD